MEFALLQPVSLPLDSNILRSARAAEDIVTIGRGGATQPDKPAFSAPLQGRWAEPLLQVSHEPAATQPDDVGGDEAHGKSTALPTTGVRERTTRWGPAYTRLTLVAITSLAAGVLLVRLYPAAVDRPTARQAVTTPGPAADGIALMPAPASSPSGAAEATQPKPAASIAPAQKIGNVPTPRRDKLPPIQAPVAVGPTARTGLSAPKANTNEPPANRSAKPDQLPPIAGSAQPTKSPFVTSPEPAPLDETASGPRFSRIRRAANEVNEAAASSPLIVP